MDFRVIILGVVCFIAGAILVEAFIRRNRPKKKLGELLKPNYGVEEDDEGNIKPPLGMEAIDMSVIKASERMNPNIDHRDPNLRRVKPKKTEKKHD